MPNSFHFRPWIILLAIFALTGAPAGFGQSLTSATLNGTVTDASGLPLPGATVTAFHEPTGTKATTVTNAVGRFLLPGLRVGGPYTVTVIANRFETKEQNHVQLELGQIFQSDFALEAPSGEVVKLERVVVTAEAGSVFDDLTAGTRISQRGIQSLPTIARSFNEYARLDPRVVMTDRFSDINNGETSAVGQNGRYNSLQIDGVRANDVYGLNVNGLPIRGNTPSIGNPLPLDAIEAFDVEISPYDVRQSGFTGASFNAVTKSGSNELHGSFYTLFSNQNLRAKNEDNSPANTNYGKREPFSEKTYGATLGGPVVKDRLFFFLAYEKLERTELAPTPGFTPDPAAVASIITNLKAAYGYDPGTVSAPSEQKTEDRKMLMKLDWNIDSRHRLGLRFSQTDDKQPVFPDYGISGNPGAAFGANSSRPGTSFSGHWYTNNQKYTSYLASLFSNWKPDFHTEARLSFSRYDTSRDPNSVFPQVAIYNVPVDGSLTDKGNLYLGTERSSQVNKLRVDDVNATLTGTWLLSTHTLTVGADLEESRFHNDFLQDAFGTYGAFVTNSGSTTAGFDYLTQLGPAGFSGGPRGYSHQYSPTGGPTEAIWKYANPAVFFQDSWKVNERLTLSSGVRLDYYTADQPAYNDTFSQSFGIRNDNSIDRLAVVSPRLGFNYALDARKKTRLRGGVGVFEGKAPAVLMSNSYSLNGITSAQTLILGNSLVNPTPPFQSDIHSQFKGAAIAYPVNLMDNDFKLPRVLKANLALDRKLPWLGLVLTLEFDETKTLEGLSYHNLNLQKTGTTPDGRNYYGNFSGGLAPVSPTVTRVDPGFTDVFLLKNTHQGEARHYTVLIQKPWKDHWSASFAYTYGQAREVSPITAATAASNFSGRMIYNSNDEAAARSNYEVRHRFLITLSREFNLIKNAPTTVSLFHEVHTGRPYSFIFSNDVNGDGSGNDLFYVPSGPGDPKVNFPTPGHSDAFFAYLNGNPDLKKYMGQVVPRNSAYSKSIQQLDLRITQRIPFGQRVRMEIFYDIINLGNLLNNHWGRYVQYNFPSYAVPVAQAQYDQTNNRYNYTFTGTPAAQKLDSTSSRWQMQLGLHLKF